MCQNLHRRKLDEIHIEDSSKMEDKVGGIEWYLRGEKKCVRVLEGKPQGKGRHGRPRCR
jgi:hypothetical protein